MSVVIAAFNQGHAIGVKEACEKLAADNGWDPQELYAQVTKKLAEEYEAKMEDEEEDKEEDKEEDDDKEDKANGYQGGTTPEPPIG